MTTHDEPDPHRPDGAASAAAASAVPPPFSGAQSTATLMLDRSLDFSWENLTYRVRVADDDETGKPQWKTLLHRFNGTARAGRLLAVMGPSGSGKTTLFNCITGRAAVDDAHKLDGCVFLNDTVYSERYRKLVSVVAQDDIVMGKETPRDSLYFSCRVRLGLGHEEATARTEETLRKLRLTKCADTLLGIPGLIKGVSGGEKKRANIGVELVTNPYVLLLDEPTTGLDSLNALRVGELLRDLAHDEHRTVMCTIHSPSSELFAVFDDLLLLGRGHVIYHGPVIESMAYFASVGYHVPPMTNPSEYYMNLLQLPAAELEKLWLAWEAHAVSAAAERNLSIAPMAMTVSRSEKALDARASEKAADYGTQLRMLTARAWRMFMRDPASTIGRTIQTVFFAILLGLFFFKVGDHSRQGVQDRVGAIFMTTINSIFLAAMSGLAAFPPERAVFLQEQTSDSYNAFVYFFAKNVAELPLQIAFPVGFVCVMYFMVGFHSSAAAFFSFLGMVILIANTGTSFGLVAASVFASADVAMAVVPLTMLPMMIVAGLFANTDRLDPAWLWLNYLSFPRYGFVGLFLVEFERLDNICPLTDMSCPYKTGAQVVQFYGFENYTVEQCAGALVAFIVGLRVLGAISLYMQGKSRRGNLPFTENLEVREMSPRALASARSPAAGDRAPPGDDGGADAGAAAPAADAPAFKADE